MKRTALLQHLRKYGCVLKREGRAHSLWTNPVNGAVEAIPRHTFPPLFGPLSIRAKAAGYRGGAYDGADGDRLRRRIQLTDGGVYTTWGLSRSGRSGATC